MKKKLFFLLFILLACGTAQAQKNISTQHVVWFSYINNLAINPKWTLQTELQTRYFLADKSPQHLWATRAKLTRKLGGNWDMTMGFAYFKNLRNTPEAKPLGVPELRPLQEWNNRYNLGKRTQINHRYMIEERFIRKTANGSLADGYNFNVRFRYRLGADFDLFAWKKGGKPIKLRVFDEVMLNAGKKIVQNAFDQNRIFTALVLPFGKNFSVEAGYMNMFQQRNTGIDFFDRNILRVTLQQRVSL